MCQDITGVFNSGGNSLNVKREAEVSIASSTGLGMMADRNFSETLRISD